MRRARWAFGLLSLMSSPALAAPYCLQPAGVTTPQCIYADERECLDAAARYNGSGASCTVNTAEVQPPPNVGGPRFCAVFNGPVFDCVYVDRTSCDVDSARRGGICYDTTPNVPDVNQYRR